MELILKEEEREERLAAREAKQKAWRADYWRTQEAEISKMLSELRVLEEAIFMEWEEVELRDLLMEWEENANRVERVLEDMEVDIQEDWLKFLDDQDDMEYELWMIQELDNLGIDWHEIAREVTDMKDKEIYTVPATPGLSRKFGQLELEEEECLCSTRCIHDQEEGLLEDKEYQVDECLCSIRCENVHDEVISEQPLCEEVISEWPQGMKYCQEIEMTLPVYNFMPFKASTSKTIQDRFSYGQARERNRDVVDKTNPTMDEDTEPVMMEDRVSWIGSRNEDHPGHSIKVLSVLNTTTLPEKGWEGWEECDKPDAGDDNSLAETHGQPGGGGVQDAGVLLHDGGRGDGQQDQAWRGGGEQVPGRGGCFPSITVTEMISTWESLEKEGGEEEELSRPGGSYKEGGGRRTSQRFQSLCDMFTELGGKSEKLTDKPDVRLASRDTCSFSSVASTLLGPRCGEGGPRPRRKLLFRNRQMNLPDVVKEGLRLARPSANQKRERSPVIGGGETKSKKQNVRSVEVTHATLD